MDRQQLQMLRQLPIEGVAERLGLRVTRHHCLCPFHDDTHPSLSFLVRKNTFKCFVCGKSGGTIDLVMGVLHLDFLDACRWLANEHNVVLNQWKPHEKPQTTKPFDAARYERYFQQPWINSAAQKFLYQERHIDPRVVRWCRLTSWIDRQGINWLQIPYYDTTGKLIGIQNRNLDRQQHPQSPRFRFPADPSSASTTSRCCPDCDTANSFSSPREPLTVGPCYRQDTRPSPYPAPRSCIPKM